MGREWRGAVLEVMGGRHHRLTMLTREYGTGHYLRLRATKGKK